MEVFHLVCVNPVLRHSAPASTVDEGSRVLEIRNTVASAPASTSQYVCMLRGARGRKGYLCVRFGVSGYRENFSVVVVKVEGKMLVIRWNVTNR